jgi:hypothetical protein
MHWARVAEAPGARIRVKTSQKELVQHALTRGLWCVHRMFALIRQVQQLACPGYPADSDWDGEISVSVSRPFRVRACSKVGLARLPVSSHGLRPGSPAFSPLVRCC